MHAPPGEARCVVHVEKEFWSELNLFTIMTQAQDDPISGRVPTPKATFKHKFTVGQEPEKVEEILSRNRRIATPFMLQKCEREAARNWDVFYKKNGDRFFKNKNWTEREFQQELPASRSSEAADDGDEGSTEALNQTLSQEGGSSTVLLEVGCGPGNMLYPVLQRNKEIRAHCCDFSKRAIELIHMHPAYEQARINAFVFDLVTQGESLVERVATHSFGKPNVASLIFVLSAIPPQHHRAVLKNLANCLPSGGTLLFRDFGYGDLAQVRFHSKASAAWCEPALLSEQHDFYRRGDNTLTYFFNVEELEAHAAALQLEGAVEVKEVHGENRRTGVQLHRRFIQARWRKV